MPFNPKDGPVSRDGAAISWDSTRYLTEPFGSLISGRLFLLRTRTKSLALLNQMSKRVSVEQGTTD
jgi:hypothetical protein